MEKTLLDILWVLLGAVLVFVMQAGFLCLESGLTRSKNAINVAIKNLVDFAVAVGIFWFFGFGLMFGLSQGGLLGGDLFMAPIGVGGDAWLTTFFLFQAMFCATAATIVSGAVAERMRFLAYLALAAMVGAIIYPVFGHWAWGGSFTGESGWLEKLGFVDFAGSTVVHSVGGWVALAAVLIVGPRRGRFPKDEVPQPIPHGNLPMAMLGGLLLFLGWFGFNGGSTLALNDAVPGIIANTVLAAVAGILSALLLGWRLRRYAEVLYALNGAIAGLVAVTAGAHAYSAGAALIAGAVGGAVMVLSSEWLLRLRVDDAVGAIPAHLVAGIWGTLAVALLGQPEMLGTGLSRLHQFGIQLLGVVVCGAWAFGMAWLLLNGMNRLFPLRINPEGEELGLNMAEHGARTELHALLETMRRHEHEGDTSGRVPVEPFTEVGEIAAGYNRVVSALERTVAKTRLMVRNLRDGVVTWGQDGIVTALNPGAEALLGVQAGEVIGQPITRLIGSGSPQPGARLELRLRTPDHGLRILEVQVSGSEEDHSGMIRDVTERHDMEQQLQKERDLAQVTLASIRDGVITTDESGHVQFMNPEAERLTGWNRKAAKGLPVKEVYRLHDEATGQRVPNPARKVLSSGTDEPRRDDRVLISRAGDRWPVQDAAAPIRSPDGFTIGAILVFHDVTETRNLSQELNRQASHDALTGLANRREFERQLANLLKQDTGHHVLCYLDLDQFKIVNDTCGHVAGDELLRQLSKVLGAELRQRDLLARLGGDEFGILLQDCPLEQALEIAERLRRAVEDYRFSWNQRGFSVGVCIGVVEVGDHSTVRGELSTVLSAADAACYAAKEAGRNRAHVYQPDDSELLARHGEMQWVSRLQHALDEDRLRLYAQPIAPIGTGNTGVRHYEILVRLEEHGKIILPGTFLPAAERYNMMARVDRWVVRNTLAWLSSGGDKGQGCMWSVNLSGDSLSDERFREDLYSWVKQADLPSGRLCFEITESAAISRLSDVVTFMKNMRELGCVFALDDFGSGLSSFGYLKQLPVDYLKIDGRFVRDIATDHVDQVMVQSINTLGHAMGLKTIAEFVEDETILQHLEALGVDYAQGWQVGRPVPLTELVSVVLMPR